MQHHKSIRKLGRVRKGRKALLRSLSRALILHGKIQTTEAKAKELRPFVERIVTASKRDTLASRRHVISRLGSDPGVIKKLFSTIGPRYKDRRGGYTRIIKFVPSGSDARSKAQMEFIED